MGPRSAARRLLEGGGERLSLREKLQALRRAELRDVEARLSASAGSRLWRRWLVYRMRTEGEWFDGRKDT